jgi:hypothetical protein
MQELARDLHFRDPIALMGVVEVVLEALSAALSSRGLRLAFEAALPSELVPAVRRGATSNVPRVEDVYDRVQDTCGLPRVLAVDLARSIVRRIAADLPQHLFTIVRADLPTPWATLLEPGRPRMMWDGA